MYDDKLYKDYKSIIITVMKIIFIIICSLILQIFSLKGLKPKICIDCKYFLPNGNRIYGKCSFFPIIKENKIDYLVTGEPTEDELEYMYCSTARDFDDMCGEEGKMYKKSNYTFSHFKRRPNGEKK